MLEEVIKYVNKAFEPTPYKSQTKHFDRTIYWLTQLKPDADEAMKIAAYSHDIDRAFWTEEMALSLRDKPMDDPEYLRAHQNSSAKIICEFLKSRNYDADSIARIKNMVEKHEVGGDEESDLIKDADSLSFFEVNSSFFVQRVATHGMANIKGKFDFMYNRISTNKARELAKPMYDKAIKELEGYI